MPDILEINRMISSISVEAPERIFETLESLAASSSLEKPIAKAASHGLERNLPFFSASQLIKIARFYIEADTTAAVLFTQLLDEFRRRFSEMSQEEFLALFTLCDELDGVKAMRPPNQIIVQFLGDLQALLFEQMQIDRVLFRRMTSEPIASITLLEVLIRLGVPNTKLCFCQKFFAHAKLRLLPHYHTNEDLALQAFIFYCRLLSKQLQTKKGFYQEPFYQSTTAKIQWAAKQLELQQLCALAESCAIARIRDTSLMRTVARAVTAIEGKEMIGNVDVLIRLLDSYAKLNIQDSRIFDLLFERIVTNNIRPSTGQDKVSALHGIVLFGATGRSKAKVSQIVANLSPHTVTSTNAPDLLKLELIRLFCRALYPNLQFPLLSVEHLQQTKGQISPVQQAVSDFLSAHGVENECEALIECYPYPVDIVVHSHKVVIEIDGPHHFDISGKLFLGKDCLKNVLISKHWKLIRIAAGQAKKTKNLHMLLNAVILP